MKCWFLSQLYHIKIFLCVQKSTVSNLFWPINLLYWRFKKSIISRKSDVSEVAYSEQCAFYFFLPLVNFKSNNYEPVRSLPWNSSFYFPIKYWWVCLQTTGHFQQGVYYLVIVSEFGNSGVKKTQYGRQVRTGIGNWAFSPGSILACYQDFISRPWQLFLTFFIGYGHIHVPNADAGHT